MPVRDHLHSDLALLASRSGGCGDHGVNGGSGIELESVTPAKVFIKLTPM